MNKVLIFPDPEDFLKCMEDLQREYNKTVESKNKPNEAGNNE